MYVTFCVLVIIQLLITNFCNSTVELLLKY